MKIISSWSGGKDSCLACFKAMQQSHEISCLLNFISEETKRGCFHGIDSKLMKAQSDAIGIPICQNEVSADMAEYEKEFKSAVLNLKKEDINGIVFGDIYLLEHTNWVDRVCGEIGIKPLEPLWNLKPENIANEFIDLGFKAIIVSAKADLFDDTFIGREFDKDAVRFLIEKKICPCGENGEFHTFVYDGPIFKKKIKITKTEKIFKDGFWKHWFLDLKEYYMEEK
ncbi:MAG: hypothetical protein A2539_06180 [Elusimicrobia bacterium RIFOXYD2_FULL_34_15]|nr:MAG: hypothetical protein A2539_06180 [Elusimicrobia bacterium RIFOXYD2_FULL_34_15]